MWFAATVTYLPTVDNKAVCEISHNRPNWSLRISADRNRFTSGPQRRIGSAHFRLPSGTCWVYRETVDMPSTNLVLNSTLALLNMPSFSDTTMNCGKKRGESPSAICLPPLRPPPRPPSCGPIRQHTKRQTAPFSAVRRRLWR